MSETDFAFGEAAGTPTASQNGSGSGSILDRLKVVTRATLEAEVKRYPVPVREGFEVGYCTFVPKSRIELLSKAHTDDLEGYQKAILLAQCREIVVGGEVWLGDDQMPVTFTSPVLWQMLEVPDAFAAIDALYVRDPDVDRTGEALLRDAGWDLSAPLDPTQP